MLFKKKGFPEEGELVLCTVNNIYPHGVFVVLDEYEKQGLIHISEVSPGRIRNLRDFVKEGKKIVCKILKIDAQRGHIDLSLRRVNDNQRKNKVNELKLEQLAEKIIDIVAKKNKLDTKQIGMDIYEKITKKYPGCYAAFEDVVASDIDLASLGIDKNIAKDLEENIRQRIKPIEIEVKGDLKLTSFEGDGVEIVKKALKKAESIGDNVFITYKGAGRYGIVVKDVDYKDADKKMEKAVKAATSLIEKTGGEAEFVKIEAK